MIIKKLSIILIAMVLPFALMSCSDDTVSVDIEDEIDDELVGTVYSLSFNVAGSSDAFTFSVDMDEAVIEGDDLPDWFEGDRLEFDPETHRVFIAGSLGGDNSWNQPGTNNELRLSRADRSPNITVEPGNVEFKFFIVFDDMDFNENQGWGMGEWEGDPNRSVEVSAGGDVLIDFGIQIDEEPSASPESVFMIGSALTGNDDGWNWDNVDFPLVSVHSKDMFWTIVWLYEDGEFKFAPQRAWENDFGSDGVDPADEIYAMGGSNITVPGATGYYMVVVNFETEEVSVTAPQVYLIGDTVGSWDTANADALFTVDNTNEVLTITKDLLEANLRMYAWFDKGWFTDWWQSEFMIFDGLIEFRGEGDDQAAVGIDPAGEYKIDLNFRTGEGSIEAQ